VIETFWQWFVRPWAVGSQAVRSHNYPMTVLSSDELGLIDEYWRAANYLSVGQIYLLDNPLLREPLQTEHVKPRLLGHSLPSVGVS
jgi:xylulose-5-phosphate/fructose-6-phosphate phosphoketolase